MDQISQPWWVTPVATLVAALLGGMLPLISALLIFERQGERERLSILASKSEGLIRELGHGIKVFSRACNELRIDQGPRDRLALLMPFHDSLIDQKSNAVTMLSETQDDHLRTMIAKVVSEINNLQILVDQIPSFHMEVRDFKEFQDSIIASQRLIESLSLATMMHISALREQANRSTINKLRDAVRRA